MKIAIGLIVAMFLLVLAAGGYYAFGTYSEGFRAGTVIKLSSKGVVFKTYEGQLNLGMVLSEGGTGTTAAEISNIWNFSVPKQDTAVLRKLEEAMLSGKRSKLHYAEKFVALPWRGDTHYLVTSVESLH